MSEVGRNRCCDEFLWVEVADFGTVARHDLTLGRCGSCGMPVMTVVEIENGSVSRVSLTRAEERAFLGLRDDPVRLKAALQTWVG
jgi:hypothetical protein